MIKKTELESLKNIIGFNLWQIEKDYLQHLILLFLSKHAKDELVFKGGTALQKIYGLNRFSIDLDFTGRKEKIESIFENISQDINKFGYRCELKKKGGPGLNFSFKINGPLYDGDEKTSSNIRAEISLRKDLLLKPIIKEIVPVYPDIQPYVILVMHIDEILAEKTRAVMTRDKPRDVYDIWFLLRKGAKFNLEFANKKLKYYSMEFEKRKFAEAINRKSKNWEMEMNSLIANAPVFELVKKEIIEAFQ